MGIEKNFIILCDNASLKDKKLSIEGVFDAIYAPSFPATHKTMYIVSHFEIDPGSYNEKFVITRPDGTKFTSQEFPFEAEKSRHQFIQQLNNLALTKEGKYTVEIYINNELIGSNYFLANQQ